MKKDNLLDLKFSDIKNNSKNKDLIYGVENNIKYDNGKSDLKNKLLESITKYLFLLQKDNETKFINAKNHLVKLKILNINDKGINLDDKDYINFKKDEMKNAKNGYRLVQVVESMMDIMRNDNAYFLI